MNSKTEKKFNELGAFMSRNNMISEFNGNKDKFKKLGTAFLRAIANDLKAELEIKDSKVSFNPGGPAVAGDPSLYIMGENTGVAIYITENMNNSIMYRKITSMKDYAGDQNRWASFDDNTSNLYRSFKKLIS